MEFTRKDSKTKGEYYYIYLITNKCTGMKYVGVRMDFIGNPYVDKGYMGSSRYLYSDMVKYGRFNFTKEILEFERFINR